ncbi:MAG: hypothetical protein AABY42_06495 [Nitrospirota bacterium]|jgi:hypothetical protein
MGALDFIKGLLSGKERGLREQVRGIRSLSGADAERELGLILYNICVESASSFVNQELNRGDSPFRGLQKHRFFHEIALLTFWLAEKGVIGNRKNITEEIQRNYLKSINFHLAHDDGQDAFHSRYKSYYSTWDDVTGHQDLFGMKAAGYIFEEIKEESNRPDITFWLIVYSDDTLKKLIRFKRLLKESGVRLKQPTGR